jgi:hypothetical protein
MYNSEPILRVHPAIGLARVGNSPEYYLGPETIAGMPVPGSKVTGGLPIRAGTESDHITDADLRDQNGAFRRQAARFRIFAYPAEQGETYPSGEGTEIRIGSVVGGKTVADIIWTVHVANKKANWYVTNDDLGLAVYERAHASELAFRNAAEGDDLNNAARLRKLVIDPGPRAIRGESAGPVRFDKRTFASYRADGSNIRQNGAYPKSFPDDAFTRLYTPTGKIESLGELRTDEFGRLLVLGGYGKACSWTRPDGTPFPLSDDDVNSDGWFDDTSDGPVDAAVVFEDGSVADVHGGWVVCTDPGYAPQTLNVISLWDEIYDTWVRELGLQPELYGQRFNSSFRPYFDQHIYPIFRATALQRWNTNLPVMAVRAHDAVGAIQAHDDPARTIMTGLAFVRNPNNPGEAEVGGPLMPLSLGDAGKPFLLLTPTQYFFLKQWDSRNYHSDPAPPLGPGEFLDRAVLMNCLGGRFSPGIDMTFLVRDPQIYLNDWGAPGPFRIRARKLDYDTAQASQPFLSIGYVPLHPGPDGVTSAPLEPGDTSKFMSIPWHTDYNSCATHHTSPNPLNSTTLYWSWPAQRPVDVYRAADVRDGQLGPQRYSVRGAGTYTTDLAEAGRYQELIQMVFNWHRIGVIMDSAAIESYSGLPPGTYLEVQSQLDEREVAPWPMNAAV